jgi:hypothetical protein
MTKQPSLDFFLDLLVRRKLVNLLEHVQKMRSRMYLIKRRSGMYLILSKGTKSLDPMDGLSSFIYTSLSLLAMTCEIWLKTPGSEAGLTGH